MTPIDSVECYSHKTDAWTMMGRMISARRGAGVTTLDTNIYAVGGFDGELFGDSLLVLLKQRRNPHPF